jgi:catechol 2,3-dioxygenase-like lactoylglutathione lyase family enzyme
LEESLQPREGVGDAALVLVAELDGGEALPGGSRRVRRVEGALLAAREVTLIDEIAWESGVRSCYFNDPAGNLLEIAERDLWAE